MFQGTFVVTLFLVKVLAYCFVFWCVLLLCVCFCYYFGVGFFFGGGGGGGEGNCCVMVYVACSDCGHTLGFNRRLD